MRNIEIIKQEKSSLTTLEDTKEYLEIEGTDNDNLLQQLIGAASQFIKTETGYEWVETTYKELIDGERTETLILTQKPIISVTSLVINGATIDSGNYYIYNESGMLKRQDVGIYDVGYTHSFRKGLLFPRGQQNIEVKYVAGYSDVPVDLQKAVWSMVNTQLDSKNYEGLESYSIGDESMKWRVGGLPAEAQQTIMRYKSVV